MNSVVRACGVIVLVLALLSGCQQPGGANSSVAIIDLAAIAKATGQEEIFQQKMDAYRIDINTQLQQAAAELDRQLTEERAKLSDTPEDQQIAQALLGEAQRQMGEARNQAQNQVQQFEISLFTEFRTTIEPLAAEITERKGVKTVLMAGPQVFWFDSSIDITADVIAAWRAAPPADVAATADEVAAPDAAEEAVAAEDATEAAAE